MYTKEPLNLLPEAQQFMYEIYVDLSFEVCASVVSSGLYNPLDNVFTESKVDFFSKP